MSVTKRKHISDRTKLAAALARPCPWCGYCDVPYVHAKLMHEDQIISLYQFDHNVMHLMSRKDFLIHIFTGLCLPDVDHFSNLAPMLIAAHREKTKTDIKQIRKGDRIRKRVLRHDSSAASLSAPAQGEDRSGGLAEKRKLRSRGFNKTLTRRMDGKVVTRKRSK